jgi:hypothetical protein
VFSPSAVTLKGMSNLYQRRYLNCPYARAKELLAQTLAAAATSGDAKLLQLRLQLAEGASLSKEVVVTVAPGADPMHFDQPWRVQWVPTTGGLYPSFSGTLTVRADENYETSILEVAGGYEPPLGAVGAAFDSVIGSRIAHATARELLRSIGSRMEEQYRAEEAGKPAAASAGIGDDW